MDDTTKEILSGGHPSSGLVVTKARLVVITGQDEGKEFLIDPYSVRARIGTSPENDLVLSDKTVSRFHAEILPHHGGYLLRDLASTNGTSINKVRVQEAFLQPGAVLQVGETEIQVLPLEEHRAIRPSPKARCHGLLGESQAMRRIFAIIEKVGPADLTVLLTGDTGTGKELAALALHESSARAERPFVVLDCGAIPDTLLESELFGHEKGAFTGAVSLHRGAFERAEGGTLFLDEIGELRADLQPKLLRALEQQVMTRVGGEKPLRLDVRIIAATNRNLAGEVKAGRFRQDLFFRLSVIQVTLPPLRERREDLPLLIDHFLEAIPEASIRSHRSMQPATLEMLMTHSWPGNVRELKNAVGRIALLGEMMDPKDLFSTASVEGTGGLSRPPVRSLEELERSAITKTLGAVKGNKAAAARILGIAPSTLYEKMKKYGIHA